MDFFISLHLLCHPDMTNNTRKNPIFRLTWCYFEPETPKIDISSPISISEHNFMPIHAGRGRSNILCQRPHSRTQNLHYILLCAQLVRNVKLSFPKPLKNMEFFQDFVGRLLADKWLEILQQICVVRQRGAVIS